MAKKAVVDNPQARADYIAHGSEEHALFLGLRLAEEGDPEFIKVRSKKDKTRVYVLVDMTMFGPTATEAYLREVCRQKVAELDAGSPAEPQTEDPRKPNYAQPLWVPPEINM